MTLKYSPQDVYKVGTEFVLSARGTIAAQAYLIDELVEGAYNAQQRIIGVLQNHEAGETLNPAILRGALDALTATLAKARGES